MSRYTGPSCRLCRREGVKLYLKGDRCYTPKCALERRKTPPGQHGLARRKPSQYAIQLREKQKLRRIYGLSERQFKLSFEKAEKMKGVVGDNFMSLLERRLDNVVYRMGMAISRCQARQLINHGHVLVNGKKVDIPSYVTKPGEEVTVREKSKEMPSLKMCMEVAKTKTIPNWLSFESDNIKGKVTAIPVPEDFSDIEVNKQLVVEFYSR